MSQLTIVLPIWGSNLRGQIVCAYTAFEIRPWFICSSFGEYLYCVKKKKKRQDYIQQICHQKGAAKTLKQVAVINCKSFYYFEFQHVYFRNVFYNGRFIINTVYMYPTICLNIEHIYLILKMKPEALFVILE